MADQGKGTEMDFWTETTDAATTAVAADAGHFSRTVSQRSDAIAHTIGGYPVHQATSAGAA